AKSDGLASGALHDDAASASLDSWQTLSSRSLRYTQVGNGLLRPAMNSSSASTKPAARQAAPISSTVLAPAPRRVHAQLDRNPILHRFDVRDHADRAALGLQ